MIEMLKKIGLTRGEAEVYLTLLKTGNTTTGKIINKGKISRSKVYEVLEKLKQKGLVTEMIKKNTKHFEAVQPKKILDYINEQKKEIEIIEQEAKKTIPQLMRLQGEEKEEQETKIYVGIEGWKTLYNEILNRLKRGEEYLAFGIGPEEIKDEKLQTFIGNFHSKRERRGIKARIIMKEETRNVMKEKFSHMKKYNYKFSEQEFPTSINIHKNNVIILNWAKNPIAFLIKSEQVATRYKEYFESIWKRAKN